MTALVLVVALAVVVVVGLVIWVSAIHRDVSELWRHVQAEQARQKPRASSGGRDERTEGEWLEDQS